MNSAPWRILDLVNQFREAGLDSGDNVLVHSSFRSLGKVEGGPQAVLQALLEVIGKTGNLMFPTFNYSRPLPEPYYDPCRTPCRTGIIPETGRAYAGALRSLHPTHSVVVIGPQARALTEKHLEVRAFGIGSPLDLFQRAGAKVLLLGVGQCSNSTLHLAEEYAGIAKYSPCNPLPFVKIRLPGNEERIIEHQLDTSPSCSRGFEAAAYCLRHEGIVRDARIGDSLAQFMKASDVVAHVGNLLKDEPNVLRCSDPCCIGCNRARREGLENKL